MTETECEGHVSLDYVSRRERVFEGHASLVGMYEVHASLVDMYEVHKSMDDVSQVEVVLGHEYVATLLKEDDIKKK